MVEMGPETSSHHSFSKLPLKSQDEGRSINWHHTGNNLSRETRLKVQAEDNMALLNIQGKSNDSSQSNPISPSTRFDFSPSNQRQNGDDTLSPSPTSDQKPEKDPSEEEIIQTALSYPATGRRKITPRAFDKHGNLLSKYHYLRLRISEKRSIRQAAGKGPKTGGNTAGMKKRSKTRGKTMRLGQEESDQRVQTVHHLPCAEQSELEAAHVESTESTDRWYQGLQKPPSSIPGEAESAKGQPFRDFTEPEQRPEIEHRQTTED